MTSAQLYSADLLQVSKPVKRKRVDKPISPPSTESEPSEKADDEVKPAPRKRAVKKETVKPEETVEESKPVEPEPVPEVKPKKPRTEKQLAALEKAKEARRLKKEAADKEKAEKAAQAELANKLKAEKKEQAKQRRRELQALKKQELVSSEPLPKPKVTVKQNKSDPPQWFKKYVEGVKQEQTKLNGDKKPVKQVRQEAGEEAETKWKDNHTRDRVTHEVDSHMNRMYGMIFGARRAMNK